MRQKRRKFNSAFKAQVAIKALKDRESLTELSRRFEVHPNILGKWKQKLLENSASVFDEKSESVPGNKLMPISCTRRSGQLEI